MNPFVYIGALFAVFCCQSRQKIKNTFEINVYYESNLTPGAKYIITDKKIQVLKSDDFRWRTSKVIYSAKVSPVDADSLFKLLNKIRIDTTAGKVYSEESISDGGYTHFQIKLRKLPVIKFTTYAKEIESSRILTEYIERRLLPEKYYPSKVIR